MRYRIVQVEPSLYKVQKEIYFLGFPVWKDYGNLYYTSIQKCEKVIEMLKKPKFEQKVIKVT